MGLDLYIEYIKELLVRAELEGDFDKLQAIVSQINHILQQHDRQTATEREP